MRVVALLLALVLAVPLLPARATGESDLLLSGFTFTVAPRQGAGASPVENHVLVRFDVANPSAADAVDVTAFIVTGAGITLSTPIHVGTVPAGATLHVEADTNAIPSAWYCVGFDRGARVPTPASLLGGTCAVASAPLP